MKRLNVGARLGLGFGFLILLMVIMTAASITVITQTRDNLAKINEVHSVKKRHAINYRGSVHDRAVAVRDVVLLQSDDDRAGQIALIEQLAAAYAENETQLSALLSDQALSTEEEVALHDQISEIQARVIPQVDDIVQLMLAGERDRALNILIYATSAEFSAWLDAINAFINLQEARSLETGAVVSSTVKQFSSLSLYGVLAALILAAATAWLTARSITRPLASLRQNVQQMSRGEALGELGVDNRTDEIGALARSIDELRQAVEAKSAADLQRRKEEDAQACTVVTNLGAALHSLAAGDLDTTLPEPFAEKYEKLRLDFNALSHRMSETISSVVDSSGSIRSGAAEISQASSDLAHRTESQAATLEQSAAALDELAQSVKSAAAGAKSVESTMETARTEAEASDAVVQDAVGAMAEIEESSNKISQIISVIDDIAFQTNLLALNAGVEAARAGEAGRGFAVVASEVRALAQRASGAAMEIKTLIEDSSGQVERGVDLVGRAGEALQNINSKVGHISQLVSEIAEGAAEQATGLNEISAGMTQLDQVTQQNAAMVEEVTAAGDLLNSDARALTELVGGFRGGRVAGNRPVRGAPSALTAVLEPQTSGVAPGSALAASSSTAPETVEPAASPHRPVAIGAERAVGGSSSAAAALWEDF
ncbi:methyl-accepting chemotaxis protein [Phaeobacter sp.]|uniref:methyl-accepting chemotaxis protein n=1 Tax=Phaeobacter sp. TaxID=1902409 RepID=UPI0025F681CC|nr:methyl-accepting chemotaxis protein [Phaeobacter sp.]